jgi:hypothetical protein
MTYFDIVSLDPKRVNTIILFYTLGPQPTRENIQTFSFSKNLNLLTLAGLQK